MRKTALRNWEVTLYARYDYTRRYASTRTYMREARNVGDEVGISWVR